ncbi:uncharacterized protein LOC129939052 [Eupeodes corollae]|uniref:uncharacterized protein LOC129939052 n=1 Tax=Eupeodes corollae TaxID=290404 RepID=UPI002490A1FF|nr:uncharacterized protein LOC129939052 [Eupeodes corollae]
MDRDTLTPMMEEKYSDSAMFHSSPLSPTASTSTTFDINEYTVSTGENSPINGTTKTMTIVDGRFFRMIPDKCVMNTTVATCVKCEPRYIEIKGNVNSSSNFLCHLKRKHGREAVLEYTEYLHSKKRCRRGQASNASEGARQVQIKVRQIQEQLDMKILKFIVNSMVPMATVTNSYFLEIFKHFNVNERDLRAFNREVLNTKLVSLYKNVSEKLQQDLKSAIEVFFVANVWKWQEKRSLVTMAHWIDGEMKRQSAVLMIKQLPPIDCRYDSLEHNLMKNREDFNICQSIRINSSSGASCDLLKAFLAYGIGKHSIADSFQEVDDEITMENDILLPLSPSFCTCNVQVLRNFASFDIIKMISNCKMLANLHGRVMQKCNILWSHPDANDILEEITGNTLAKPSVKSWISLYTALGEVLTIQDKSVEIFQAFETKDYLSVVDFVYIEEHLACTKPLADALAILEDPKHSLYGSLLPTLLALRRHLIKLSRREWQYCGPLVAAIANMVNEKFQKFYNFADHEAVNAAIAAFSHPEFKNRWLSCVDMNFQTNLLNAFKEAVEKEIPQTQPQDTKTGALNAQSRSDFFDFGSENEVIEPMPSKAVVDMQVLNYFNYSSRTLDSLEHFPAIYAVFMKYNSPLSSFTIAEQMVDHDILQKVLMTDGVRDKYLEMTIWLKANNHLF